MCAKIFLGLKHVKNRLRNDPQSEQQLNKANISDTEVFLFGFISIGF